MTTSIQFNFQEIKQSEIVVLNHYRVILEDDAALFYLEKGQMDLYFLVLDPDYLQENKECLENYIKTRESFTPEKMEGNVFFFRAWMPNQLFFSFPYQENRTIHVLGRANGACVIGTIDKEALQLKMNADEAYKQAINRNLFQSLSTYQNLFSSHRLNFPSMQITEGEEKKCEAKMTVMARPLRGDIPPDLLWLEARGSFTLFGLENTRISENSGFYPLMPGMWLTCLEPSQIKVLNKNEVTYDPNFWRGLTSFGVNVLKVFEYNFTNYQSFQKNQILRSRDLDAVNFAKARYQLETILEIPKDDIQKQEKNILFMASYYVCKSQNISLTPVKLKAEDPIQKQLAKICSTPRVYFRKIKLTPDWWKQDLGPFLAFLGKEQSPVALLPKSKTYEMIDPAKGRKVMVDQALDDEISSFGFMFYPSFPPKKSLGGMDLFRFTIKGQLKTVSWIGLLGGISMGLALFLPMATGIVYDKIIPFSEDNLLLQLALGLTTVIISSSIFNYARDFMVLRLQGILSYRLQSAVWQRLFDLPLSFFRKYEVGDMMMRVNAVDGIRQRLAGPNLRAILNGFFGMMYLAQMFYYNVLMGVVGLFLALLNTLFSAWSFSRIYSMNLNVVTIQAEANSLVIQFLAGITKIRIAGAENLCFVLWEKLFYKIKQGQWMLEQNRNRTSLVSYTFNNFSKFVIYAAAIYVIQNQIAKNEQINVTIGTFIAFLAAFTPFFSSINDLSNTLMDIATSIAQWKRSRPIFDEPPEVDPARTIVDQVKGDIMLEHIFFRYDPTSPYILEDVSIKAKPGEFIAIVGASGSGKTSLIRMLIGFETPESGSVYYDGRDLASLDLRSLRKQLGIVLQTSTLFSGSLRENIVTGGSFSDQEVKAVLKMSGFEEDLKQLPMGLDTIVTNEGTTFSGGQKQRLLIARALINKPKILIFDEATSALDNKTQTIITTNLEKLNVTRLVIAHRLSTIRMANTIYVMDKGKIIQTGTFSELIAEKGLFKVLAAQQRVS